MSEFDLIGSFSAADANARAALLKRRGESNRLLSPGHEEEARDYIPSPELRSAANAALWLGRPLLLTGLPGTGKTQAAYWLADELDLGEVIKLDVKSESRARDLLYEFDALSWFRASQVAEQELPRDPHIKAGPLGTAFGWKTAPEQPMVVLIDEVDKAPRDFPNDLLNELDQMRFTIAEDNNREVICPPDCRPVIVITSNEERSLPPPFLRRCVQHRIELDAETVNGILVARIGSILKAKGEVGDERAEAEKRFISAGEELWRSRDRHVDPGKCTIAEFWRWLAIIALNADVQRLIEAAEKIKKRDFETLRAGCPFSSEELQNLARSGAPAR